MLQFLKNKKTFLLMFSILLFAGCTPKYQGLNPEEKLALDFEEAVIAEFNAVKKVKGLPQRQIIVKGNKAFSPYTPQVNKLGY